MGIRRRCSLALGVLGVLALLIITTAAQTPPAGAPRYLPPFTAPHFDIVNRGTTAVAVTESMLRYWFTVDGSRPQAFNCDWTLRGCSTLSALWPGTQQLAPRREGTMSGRRSPLPRWRPQQRLPTVQSNA
jgi:hypothetical protein